MVLWLSFGPRRTGSAQEHDGKETSRDERAHESSSFESSSLPLERDSSSSSSTAFLTIFFWMSGWGVIALRITRRGIASVAGAPAGAADTTVGADCDPDGASAGAAPRTGCRAADGTCAAPPPPPGGRCTSRINDPHLWQTLAVTELRVPHVGHGFEPILRISSSSRSQSSKVRKVGCLRHHSWNSRSDRSRPSWLEASCRSFATTSSYCRRIFSS